jgi:hypothetical protein
MDIHFCDLCGVRVTDIDLRGGHGIRKQYDVICGTCLELGHGKEWLAKHQRAKGATAASQPLAAPMAVATNTADSPVIANARDRVRTLEEGDESPAVAPRTLAAEEPEDGTATGELDGEAIAEPAPAHGNQFAAAASSFSALARPEPVAAVGTGDVDDAQQGEGLSDESKASPVLADDQDGAGAEAGDSPFGFKEDSGKGPSQKDETLPVDREPLMAEKPASSPGTKKPSASASFKRQGGASSPSTPKASKSRTPKGSGRGKAQSKNKNILVMSALSIGILTMIMLITISALQKPKKVQEVIRLDMSEDLKAAIKDAKISATLALKSKKIDELKAAKAKIQQVQPMIYKFSDEAKAQNKDAWDDEAFGRYLEVVDWPNTNMLIRPLNDEIVKQGSN